MVANFTIAFAIVTTIVFVRGGRRVGGLTSHAFPSERYPYIGRRNLWFARTVNRRILLEFAPVAGRRCPNQLPMEPDSVPTKIAIDFVSNSDEVLEGVFEKKNQRYI